MIAPLEFYAHRPGLLRGYAVLERATARLNVVDKRLRALAELKAATLTGCEFCIDMGSQISRRWGLTDAELRALPGYRDSPLFSDLDKIVLDYAAGMSRTPVRVPDELFRLTESPDRKVRAFVIRALWTVYRDRGLTPDWKPPLPPKPTVGAKAKKDAEKAAANRGEGVPHKPEKWPAEKPTLSEFLRRILFEIPPGRPEKSREAVEDTDTTDPNADTDEEVARAGRWRDFSPDAQADWASSFASLALCKSFVSGVFWDHLSDAGPHRIPHGGLVDARGGLKPAFDRLRLLREEHLK